MQRTGCSDHPCERVELSPESIAEHDLAVKRGNARLRHLFDELRFGHNVDWESVRGIPGLRLEPLSWEELREIILDGSPAALGRLGRDPIAQRDYWLFREQKKKEYQSMTDYLLHTVFKLKTKEAEDGKLEAVIPPGFKESEDVVWRPNDYPYDLEPGIEHHNLWSSHCLSDERIGKEVRKHREGYDFLWFINPSALMSVPTIWHAQVLSRRKNGVTH
ncbi:hypothetical protein ACKKBF_B39360 [Auxenochlorella protothecoides x Auxenochlorella symbiontica]